MDSQIALLRKLAEQGQAFAFQNFCTPNKQEGYGGKATPEWTTWITRVNNLITQYFSPTSPVRKVLIQGQHIVTEGNGQHDFERQKTLLLKAIEMAIEVMHDDAFGELNKASTAASSPALSTRVFVVHGHDHALKTEVEALLHQLGLDPVVLHRQPDIGRTLIEKFEEYSDVGFAFVLLTPDDVAYTADQEPLPDAERRKELRARPNVVFEHGYFVGKLGRQRVCCLHRGNVTLPSDLAGLLYKSVDGSLEAQAFSIIKELKAAGYKIAL